MNKVIAKDLEYKSFGELFVMDEHKYFKGVLCDCWCQCGSFLKVNKEDLISGNKTNCGGIAHNNPKKIKFSKRKRSNEYINKKITTRYNLLVHNRKNGAYDINLTLNEYHELSENKECHYCGAEIDWLGRSSAYYLDRKDNSLGYSKENCVVCCSRCNMAKGNRFTYEEWLSIGTTIKSWKNNKINDLQ